MRRESHINIWLLFVPLHLPNMDSLAWGLKGRAVTVLLGKIRFSGRLSVKVIWPRVLKEAVRYKKCSRNEAEAEKVCRFSRMLWKEETGQWEKADAWGSLFEWVESNMKWRWIFWSHDRKKGHEFVERNTSGFYFWVLLPPIRTIGGIILLTWYGPGSQVCCVLILKCLGAAFICLVCVN